MTKYLAVKCHGVCTFQMVPQEEKLAWLPSRFSHVQLFATLWTVTRQAPLPMHFSRQEYWSRLSCPPLGVFLTQDWICVFFVSCIGRWVLYHQCQLGSPEIKQMQPNVNSLWKWVKGIWIFTVILFQFFNKTEIFQIKNQKVRFTFS